MEPKELSTSPNPEREGLHPSPAVGPPDLAETSHDEAASCISVTASKNATPSTSALFSPVTPDSGPVQSTGTPVGALAQLFDGLIVDQHGNVHVLMQSSGNPHVLRVGSRELNGYLRKCLRSSGVNATKRVIDDMNEALRAEAEVIGQRQPVWVRAAPVAQGLEIALYDEQRNVVRITPGKVEVLGHGSETYFHHPVTALPLALPADTGDFELLRKYINFDPMTFVLYVGYLTYTLALPKVPSSNYVVLVLQGEQGSGKSQATRVTTLLVDPNMVGISRLPSNEKDLAIATQGAHLLAFDNVRGFSSGMSDSLCVAATGGSVTSRKLYTDNEQQVIQLHGAVMLNGIHSFIEQPDLAQRTLVLQLQPLNAGARVSDEALAAAFEVDRPAIQRGLFDLIAQILLHLSTAPVIHPERMIDFVKWLAAMEVARGAPTGVYQGAFSYILNEGQLDALQETVLGAAMLSFATEMPDNEWTGTPAELLASLSAMQSISTQRSKSWPANPIALSKRLAPLQAALKTQGIAVHSARGKQRVITITKTSRNQEGAP